MAARVILRDFPLARRSPATRLDLSRDSWRTRLTRAHRGEVIQRARQRNQKLLAEAEAAGQLNILRNAQVAAVRPTTVLLEVAGRPREVQNDYVFILTAGSWPEEFLKRTGVGIVEMALAVNLERSFA